MGTEVSGVEGVWKGKQSGDRQKARRELVVISHRGPKGD